MPLSSRPFGMASATKAQATPVTLRRQPRTLVQAQAIRFSYEAMEAVR